jgi:hypothetical protein
MKNIQLGGNEVICQKWEELERGWGSRPDGFSLHLSFDSLKRYIQGYWDNMPNTAPDEYSRPDGTPYPVGVSDEVYLEVVESGDGRRYHSGIQYPGIGGIDGWAPLSSYGD